MVDEGRSGRGGRGSTASGDDSGTTLLNFGDEVLDNPVVVNNLRGRTSLDGGMSERGVHGRAVVTPDGELRNVIDVATSLGRERSEGAVVVKTSHGSEVISGDRRGVALGDHGVGVGGVSDNGNLDALLGALVQSLTLDREDLGVTHKEITALHTLGAGLGTDEKGSIDINEGLNGVIKGVDTAEERISTILKLHNDTLQSLLSGREIQQVELDGGGLTEHGTRGDAEEESISDVTSGTSDGNLNGGLGRGGLGDNAVGDLRETLHALTDRGGILLKGLHRKKRRREG
jgi:hypothetical protein